MGDVAAVTLWGMLWNRVSGGVPVTLEILRVSQTATARTVPTIVQLDSCSCQYGLAGSFVQEARKGSHIKPMPNMTTTPNFFLGDNLTFIVSCIGRLIMMMSTAMETTAWPRANAYRLKHE